MQQITTSGGRTFWLLQQPEPLPPAVAFDGRCFPCLMWDSGADRTVDQRSLVVTALIEAGCRYLVCGGNDPGGWEDVADDVFVMRTLNTPEAERDERMVMTTAHEAESEEEVVSFFASCTDFESHRFSDYLVLVIGEDSSAAARLCSAVRAIINTTG